MPYVFVLLLALNGALFGYCYFKPNNGGTLELVKAGIQKPMAYTNSSQDLPPLIGKK